MLHQPSEDGWTFLPPEQSGAALNGVLQRLRDGSEASPACLRRTVQQRLKESSGRDAFYFVRILHLVALSHRGFNYSPRPALSTERPPVIAVRVAVATPSH